MSDISAAAENEYGAPAQIVKRRVFESFQPTVMATAGMHALPPVHVRMPISDQYALGFIHPDTEFSQADPVTWRANPNGTAEPTNNPSERAQMRSELREQIASRRRASWAVTDSGVPVANIPGAPNVR